MREQVGSNNNNRYLFLMIASFAAVYIIWGSTYLGIKYAIDTIPSFMMGGLRFTIAGTFLYLLSLMLPGYEKPKLVHWRTSVIVGALLLAGGNGGVVVAEHYVSSSMTALLVATVPLWVILLNWLVMRSERPNWKVSAGLLIGFGGVWMLIAGRGADETTNVTAAQQLFGAVLLILASLSWAIGSLYGARAKAVKSPVQGAGMQMLSGGLLMLLVSAVSGEWTNFSFAQVSNESWLALGYLVVFGAIIAYTAYSWLLRNASPTMVSTYAYVNPAIAVVLGWAIAGETLTGQMMIGAAIIVGSVALITSQKKAKAPEPENAQHNSISPTNIQEKYST